MTVKHDAQPETTRYPLHLIDWLRAFPRLGEPKRQAYSGPMTASRSVWPGIAALMIVLAILASPVLLASLKAFLLMWVVFMAGVGLIAVLRLPVGSYRTSDTFGSGP